MTRRLMLDLETLATVPTAAIIGVSIVIQDDDPIHLPVSNSWFIDPFKSIGVKSLSTLDWWHNSVDPVVKEIIWGGKLTTRQALESISEFVSSSIQGYQGDIRFYANPASFDFPIIRHKFWTYGMEPPWSWQDERCLRSMKALLEDQGVQIPTYQNLMPHHPFYDCLEQFEELNFVLNIIKNLPKITVTP